MPYRQIHIHIDKDSSEKLDEICEAHALLDVTKRRNSDKSWNYTALSKTETMQPFTDMVQQKFGREKYVMSVLDVETVLPKPKEEKSEENGNGNGNGKSNGKKTFMGISREELYDNISRNARVDTTFLLLVVFSTIVAAIGLIEDNIAVVIGAMVIAPLLGPNLALALATALGDTELMKKAAKSNLAGFSICLTLSILLGLVWPYELNSNELLSRTNPGFDSILLAIVSGAAAVLSLTAGMSSVLVGVMVAVALLPPATTFGVMLGSGQYDLAGGAALLLAVNIVCVNLSAKIVFLMKGVGPRTWYKQQKAKKAMRWQLAFWVVNLIVLAALIYASE